jgi:hypothetical protein
VDLEGAKALLSGGDQQETLRELADEEIAVRARTT